MRILFVHQGFPAQYKHLAPALARLPGNEVVALSLGGDPKLPGVRHVRYGLERGNSPDIHPWAVDTESKIIRAEGAAKAALELRARGFYPDVICAHSGWGEDLFLKEVFPEARLLSLFEFYYQSRGFDAGFDPEFPEVENHAWRLKARNIPSLMSLETADWGLSATRFQKSSYPARFHDRISVIFEGIDTGVVTPRDKLRISLSNGKKLESGQEVITFVNRNLEPCRGYHIFMRALPRVLRERPHAQVVIIGGDATSYGAKPSDGVSYRQRFFDEVSGQLDLSRVHFLGNVQYEAYLSLLQISSVHVYLTYPFVLSWSLVEALSAGCLVVGSRTAPVEEVIRDKDNGLLVDFFDVDGLAGTVIDALARQQELRPLRVEARRTAVERYDLQRLCLPRQLALIADLAAGRRPLLG